MAITSVVKGSVQRLLAFLCFVVLKIVAVLAPKWRVQVMTTNHQFFGHLLLEPEKFLSTRDSGGELYEIDFIGEKDWRNIGTGSIGSASRKVFTVWSLGKKHTAPNRQLRMMWKRSIHCVPGFISGMLVRASRTWKLSNVSEYTFSSLLSVEQNFDDSPIHLKFSPKEIAQAKLDAGALGIDLGKPFVCLVVRNETSASTNSELRSRPISDFAEAVQVLVESDVQVVRMGATKSPSLQFDHPLVFDYANSGKRSELLDLFLASQCVFAVSTLSGPDAACLVFRKPVLYVDLANYSLCFSGTSLTTWVPARIVDESTNKALSLHQVFECGAGWFWKDSQFTDAGLRVERSTASEIAQYVREMVKRTKGAIGHQPLSEMQLAYQSTFASAMGNLGAQWHGQIRSQMSESFLSEHADWFLGR
jgi:putative glycosyltransferase (TIGR04372 family)